MPVLPTRGTVLTRIGGMSNVCNVWQSSDDELLKLSEVEVFDVANE